jgi:hypothetical protein
MKFCAKCGVELSAPSQSGERACPNCGGKNATTALRCKDCGREFPRSVLGRECPHCRAPISLYDSICPHCHVRTDDLEVHDEALKSNGENGPVIAGVLIILAGVIAIFQGLLYLVAESVYSQTYGDIVSLSCCGFLDLLLGAGAVLGGYMAITRKGFALAVLGAVAAMIGMGFLIGALLGLIGLVLVLAYRTQFED